MTTQKKDPVFDPDKPYSEIFSTAESPDRFEQFGARFGDGYKFLRYVDGYNVADHAEKRVVKKLPPKPKTRTAPVRKASKSKVRE